MTSRTVISRVLLAAFIILSLGVLSSAGARGAERAGSRLPYMLDTIDPASINTGILYDRVVPLSGIERYDGTAAARPASLAAWRQIYFEMQQASLAPPPWPPLSAFRAAAKEAGARGVIPIALMDIAYDKIREGAFEDGSLALRNGHVYRTGGAPFVEKRVIAAAALEDHTYRGASVTFVIGARWFVSNGGASYRSIQIDCDDGRGYRETSFDRDIVAHYAVSGRKTIRLRLETPDGSTLSGSFYFSVEALETPNPDDTLAVTASIPYNGVYGTGEAYVYLSNPLGTLTNPVIVVEGFDLDNTMNWDELYALLNQEGLVETMRGQGFDAVVLNFTEATDYIQRNSFVLVELIQEVLSMVGSQTDIVVIGASMGGLVARYALAYMETNALDHRTRTYISFDAPQNGADIPLGVQYWMDFFSDQSADAAFLLSRLDTPAARQMLLYHHTTPPGTSGQADPLRPAFLSDLAGAGDHPAGCRTVAIACGSGYGADQGFSAGDQIIDYEYTSFLVDITGNVWAVPDGSALTIFHGLIDIILLPKDEMIVNVSGTLPYDNAPGGWRASMAQMDSSKAPYGDIVALHDYHCFIPTVSALALDTTDPFFDIAGSPDILSLTWFDGVYYPVENEEHVTITAESAEWFLEEIQNGTTGVDDGESTPGFTAELRQNYPNPFNPSTTIEFSTAGPANVRLGIYDVEGRLVVTLYNGPFDGGTKEITWNGRDADGRAAASGMYLCRLESGDRIRTIKLVLIK